MKKIYLLLIPLSFSIINFGQQIAEEVELRRDVFHSNEYKERGQTTQPVKGGDYFWYNDFSNPSEWLIYSNPNTDAEWIITTYSTAPSGYLPVYGMPETFASTTVDNGFALFNSDLLGCMTCDPIGPTYLQFAEPIDFTGLNGVPNLEFETFYARWYDRVYFEYSLDGGSQWMQIEILTEVEMHASNRTPPDYVYNIAIPELAGQSNVLIRFNYDGEEWDYGWFIDDVRFTETITYDIGIVDSRVHFFEYIDPAEQGVNYFHYSSHYGQIPANQFNSELALSWFSAIIKNYGAEIVTPGLNVKVFGPDNALIYDETILGNTIATNEKDTINIIEIESGLELPNNPTIGKYTIVYEVFIDGVEDENIDNNFDEAYFYVTERTMSRDAQEITGHTGPAYWLNGGNDGDAIAVNYSFSFEDEIESVDIFIHETSDPGTAIIVRLYQFLPGQGWIDMSQSDVIYINQEHIGEWVNVTFSYPTFISISPGEDWAFIRVAVEFYYMESDNNLWIGIDENNNHSFWGATWYFTEGPNAGQWFSITNWQPSGLGIRVNTDIPPITANFYGTPLIIGQGESVQFYDASLGNPTSWEWTFPNGDPAFSTEQNPIVTYTNSGECFDVSLTVSDGIESDTKLKENYICVFDLYEVTFTVKDEGEEPLQEATIAITGQPNLITDATGKASIGLLPGTYNYSVSKAGYQSQSNLSFTVSDSDKEIDITLTALLLEITFKVINEEEEPLQGATIEIFGQPILITDATGKASIELSPGTYNYSVSKEDYHTQSNLSFTVSDSDKEIEITLIPISYNITFTVMNEEEEPIQGASIAITGQPILTTDATGKASIELLPGIYNYSVSKAGYQTQTDLSFTVTDSDKEIEITLITLSYNITFTVINEEEEPIQGATIAISGQTNLNTDGTGKASIELPNGTYIFSVSKEDFYTQTNLSFTVSDNDKEIEITLIPISYDITFEVTDEGEEPIQGAIIAIMGQTVLMTDETGKASIGLPTGTYTYSVSKADFITQSDLTLTVSGSDKVIEITLISLSIEDNIFSDLKIYPNPTTGHLNIENVEGAQIEFINIMGQTVKTIYNANTLNQVDISNFSKGTYILRIIKDNEISINKINLID